jgi:hypothetical protein
LWFQVFFLKSKEFLMTKDHGVLFSRTPRVVPCLVRGRRVSAGPRRICKRQE